MRPASGSLYLRQVLASQHPSPTSDQLPFSTRLRNLARQVITSSPDTVSMMVQSSRPNAGPSRAMAGIAARPTSSHPATLSQAGGAVMAVEARNNRQCCFWLKAINPKPRVAMAQVAMRSSAFCIALPRPLRFRLAATDGAAKLDRSPNGNRGAPQQDEIDTCRVPKAPYDRYGRAWPVVRALSTTASRHPAATAHACSAQAAP